MRKGRLLLSILLLVFSLAVLSGCKKNILPQSKEIGDLQLVQVIGIDKDPGDDDGFMLTIASKNLEKGSGQERPLKWHKIENQWMEIFPDIKFDVIVESNIQRSYETREPSGGTR